MFKVYANRAFLERVLLDETPKNWYNIFMSENVDEVYIPEDLDDEYVDSMGFNDTIGNLQRLGRITIKNDAEYINDIPNHPNRVLENPNAVFLLDIAPEEARKIQEKYGVICQSIKPNNPIDDSVLTQAYEYNLEDGQVGVDWNVYFDKTNHALPSNALIICDRYIFSASSESDEKSIKDAVDLGLKNIRSILDAVLPRKYSSVYNVLIVFDSSTLSKSSTLNKEGKEEKQMFKSIVDQLREDAKSNKKRQYKIRFDLISIDSNKMNYAKLHNRRIISNYFIVRAEYKLQAFNENKSRATQTIFYDALCSKIVLKPSGPNSPIKSQQQIIKYIQELIENGNCRKYASIIDKQGEIEITSVCKSCSNRLLKN